jgi:hypothetical protein
MDNPGMTRCRTASLNRPVRLPCLNSRGTTVLFDAVVVDKPRSRTSFAWLSQERLMALVARRIRQIVPQSRYGKTKLRDFLTEPDA